MTEFCDSYQSSFRGIVVIVVDKVTNNRGIKEAFALISCLIYMCRYFDVRWAYSEGTFYVSRLTMTIERRHLGITIKSDTLYMLAVFKG